MFIKKYKNNEITISEIIRYYKFVLPENLNMLITAGFVC